ncbi:MAG: glycosyl hydrolase [Desulfuromonadales bacterium]|nr:glycosyl hydrolase [Desulfuromonadales bacterium]
MKAYSLSGFLLLVAAFFLLIPSGAVAGNYPSLATSSVPSAKALGAAMLAVAHAGDRLVAVGERGIILLSDDNGEHWRQTMTPVRTTLTAVTFADSKTGWAVGHLGVVLHTVDGGESWSKQLDGVEAAALVLAAAEKRAAAERDAEERDDLLGRAQRLVDDGPDKPFLGLYFSDTGNGFIFGAFNLIFRTTDGGKTWVPWQDRVENPMELHFYGMSAVGETLYLAGEQGMLLRSDDGGDHFVSLESPYEGSYFGLITDSAGNIVAYGLRGNAYHSSDGGENWDQIEMDGQVSLSAGINLADGGMALLSQAGDLLVSSDGGQTFAPHPNSEPMPATDLAQAADGNLVVASLRGLRRIEGRTP